MKIADVSDISSTQKWKKKEFILDKDERIKTNSNKNEFDKMGRK